MTIAILEASANCPRWWIKWWRHGSLKVSLHMKSGWSNWREEERTKKPGLYGQQSKKAKRVPRLFTAHKPTSKPWSETYGELVYTPLLIPSNIIFLLLLGWLTDWHVSRKPLHQLPTVLTWSSAERIIFSVWILKPDHSECQRKSSHCLSWGSQILRVIHKQTSWPE